MVHLGFAIAVMLVLIYALVHFYRLFGSWQPEAVSVAPEMDPETIALIDLKAHLLEDLRDLELDFRMGKIPLDEYKREKRRIEPKAVATIKELEALGYGLVDPELLESSPEEDSASGAES